MGRRLPSSKRGLLQHDAASARPRLADKAICEPVGLGVPSLATSNGPAAPGQSRVLINGRATVAGDEQQLHSLSSFKICKHFIKI